jgi:two-component system nitrogen regulation response regulator GlnG
VRVIAATHQPLEALVADGRFRADLLHRLDVVRLHLPALRERRDDVPLLAERFLAAAARKLQAPVKHFAAPALQRLCAYAWPGNVRELENLCWRMAVLAPGDRIGLGDLDAALRSSSMAPSDAGLKRADWETALASWTHAQLEAKTPGIHADARARLDRILLDVALAHTGGQRGEAASRLGLGRNTVTRKLGATSRKET